VLDGRGAGQSAPGRRPRRSKAEINDKGVDVWDRIEAASSRFTIPT